MKVSIVTVVYNGVAHISNAIRSVLAQDYGNIEYIVVDGGSTDGTRQVIAQYQPRIARLIMESDEGVYDAMNKGIEAATGDVIGILNADDIYAHERIISTVVRELESRDVDSVYGDLVYTSRNDLNRIIRYWKAGQFNDRSFLQGWMPPHPTFFVKKAIYNRYGSFNTEVNSAADYELMLRFLHKHQISTAYLPEVMVYMRTGGLSNASLGSRILGHLEDHQAWKLNNLDPNFYTLLFKPIRKIKQYFTRPAAGSTRPQWLATCPVGPTEMLQHNQNPPAAPVQPSGSKLVVQAVGQWSPN
jgi:glycosyltransferase involved in cell wall biosynthesis